MRVFPQLSSGSVTQFPLRVQEQFRTIVNRTADGRRIRYSDIGASTIAWEISDVGLTDAEWLAIETLFRECEGRRKAFLFLDPCANLLTASESFSNSVWTKGPGITLSEGVNDPLSEQRATQVTNSSGVIQSLSQSVPLPAWFHYTFSIFARAAVPTQLRLVVSTDGAFTERLFELSPTWQRYSIFSSLASLNELLEVSIQMPAGATVELFGAQLDPQPAPSAYQRTLLRTGRYGEARFADDTLTQVSTHPGEHSAVLRIVSQSPVDA